MQAKQFPAARQMLQEKCSKGNIMQLKLSVQLEGDMLSKMEIARII